MAARRPRTALAALAALVLVALAAIGLRLGVDSGSGGYLSPDLPFQRRAHAIDRAFPQLGDTLIVAVWADAAEAADRAALDLGAGLRRRDEIASVFAPAADPFFQERWPLYRELEALETDLARAAGAADLIARLRQDRSVEGFLAALADATALAERAGADAAALERLYAGAAEVWAARREGRSEPLSWLGLLQDDPTSAPALRLLVLQPRLDPARLSPARPALEAVAEAAAATSAAAQGRVEIAITGEPAMRAEELRSVASGLATSFGVSFALVAAILSLGLRSVRSASLTLGLMLCSLTLATGFAALAFGALNLISVAFVVLMVGLGVDFSIHLLSRMSEERPDAPAEARAVAACGAIGGASALAAATTAAAFLAFSTTDFVGLAQLGVIGAVGVGLAFATTVTATPAAAALWSGLAPARRRAAPASSPTSRRRVLLRGAAAAGVALALAAVAREARFDADPLNLRPADAPAAAAFARLAARPDASPYRLSALAPDREAARANAAALRALPEVDRVVWIESFTPENQDAKLELIDLAWPSIRHALQGEPQASQPSPPGAARAELAERLGAPGASAAARAFAAELARGDPEPEAALEADLFRHFPDLLARLSALLEAEAVAEEALPRALVERYVAEDGRLRLEIAPAEDLRDPEARRRFIEAVAAVAPEAGGPPDQIAGAERVVGRALAAATGVALLGAAGLILAATRRLLDTAAVLAPLAAAGAATAAASVLLDAPFNYANMIVLPLLIGFGVDSGVFIARAAREERGGAFASATPRAVLTSGLTTAAAFGSLALSDHPGTASMGLLLMVALVAAVLAAFALTPAVIALGSDGR